MEAFLRDVLIGRCGYSAAVVRVEAGGRVVGAAAARDLGEPPVSDASRFDLASLTKPFVATLAARLDAEGRLPLELAIGEVLPEAHSRLAGRTLDDLLRHRSGLLPWAPLYAREVRSARGFALTSDALITDPRWWGARRGTYSDLGYVLFGATVYAALGSTLAELTKEAAGPISVQPGGQPDVVPCRLDTGREVELASRLGIAIEPLGPPRRGRAQDGNARTLGGLPGHAGLFADVRALTALGRAWLAPDRAGPLGDPLGVETVARALDGGGRYARGWRRATRRGSAGPALGPSAFGHDGFTGGSLWMDPERGLLVAMLGHRRDEHLDLGPMRRELHRLGSRLAEEFR
ncbi:MAG TPA: serine hydrolase domain-containing protein [Thermoanaerobaculia bacterium]|nr:serine hydrolase domain-containing protein [Thermoanaerobaculia bacterium]